MNLLAEAQQSPLTEIAVAAISSLFMLAVRAIEKGIMKRKYKRDLKRASLQTPPIDAPEQLAKLDAEEKATADTLAKATVEVIKGLTKKK